MRAVISSDWNDIYMFNTPIVIWAWQKLGVYTHWFQKNYQTDDTFKTYEEGTKAIMKLDLIKSTLDKTNTNWWNIHFFDCPPEKAATYAQCSRLFACCLDLPEDEILVTSDVDMLVFKKPPMGGGTSATGVLTGDEKQVKFSAVYGADLVPKGQLPMCYVTAQVRHWRKLMGTKGKSYQECIDEQLAQLEAEHFRGNFWSRDQEILWKAVNHKLYPISSWEDIVSTVLINRAKPGTQFAENRLDRDDTYILDRLSPDIVDYHMNRPLWEPKNFEILMAIMKYFWPDEDFTWIIDYKNEYIKLL